MLREITYQHEASVDQAESSGTADASAAVDHRRSNIAVQYSSLSHLVQELQERHRWARNPEIWPGGVVELHYFTRLVCLQVSDATKKV